MAKDTGKSLEQIQSLVDELKRANKKIKFAADHIKAMEEAHAKKISGLEAAHKAKIDEMDRQLRDVYSQLKEVNIKVIRVEAQARILKSIIEDNQSAVRASRLERKKRKREEKLSVQKKSNSNESPIDK